jgi:hypothetical protein
MRVRVLVFDDLLAGYQRRNLIPVRPAPVLALAYEKDGHRSVVVGATHGVPRPLGQWERTG